jgi:hypothetical protein
LRSLGHVMTGRTARRRARNGTAGHGPPLVGRPTPLEARSGLGRRSGLQCGCQDCPPTRSRRRNLSRPGSALAAAQATAERAAARIDRAFQQLSGLHTKDAPTVKRPGQVAPSRAAQRPALQRLTFAKHVAPANEVDPDATAPAPRPRPPAAVYVCVGPPERAGEVREKLAAILVTLLREHVRPANTNARQPTRRQRQE